MGRTDLKANEQAFQEWMRSYPNPADKLAGDARINPKTAKAILFEKYVPSAKIRWTVSMAMGIPETELWRPKTA